MKTAARRLTAIAALLLTACPHHSSRRWMMGGAILSEELLVDDFTGRPVYLVADDTKVVVTPEGSLWRSSPLGAGDALESKLISPTAPMTTVVDHSRLEQSIAFSVLSRGASYGDDFAQGAAAKIWSGFTVEAKAARSDEASFSRTLQLTHAELGDETKIRGEYVAAAKNGCMSYWRNSVYEKAPKGIMLEITFAPDSTRDLTGLAVYRAETRPIRVRKVESAAAQR